VSISSYFLLLIVAGEHEGAGGQVEELVTWEEGTIRTPGRGRCPALQARGH